MDQFPGGFDFDTSPSESKSAGCVCLVVSDDVDSSANLTNILSANSDCYLSGVPATVKIRGGDDRVCAYGSKEGTNEGHVVIDEGGRDFIESKPVRCFLCVMTV